MYCCTDELFLVGTIQRHKCHCVTNSSMIIISVKHIEMVDSIASSVWILCSNIYQLIIESIESCSHTCCCPLTGYLYLCPLATRCTILSYCTTTVTNYTKKVVNGVTWGIEISGC